MKAKSLKFPVVVRKGSCVVKIYRDPRRDDYYYRLAYYLGGQRKRACFNTYAEAKEEADAVVAKQARGDLDALLLTGKDRLIYGQALEEVRGWDVRLDQAAREYADARKALGGLPLAAAVHFYAKHHRDVEAVAVQEATERFLNTKREGGLSVVYLKDLGYRLRDFKARFRCPLSQLTPDDVRAFLDSLKLTARGYNNFVRTLKTFFRYCQARRWISKEVDLLEGIELRKEVRKAVEIFTPDELTRLLGQCSPTLAAGVALVAFAGVRMEELLRLGWEDIYRRRGFVEIEAAKAKTARRRLVPMLSNLEAWLAQASKTSGPLWPHSKPFLFEAVLKAAELEGIKWKRNGLRHSFISYRLAITQNKHQVAEEAGNSPRMIDSHYRELVTPEEAEKWFCVRPGIGSSHIIRFSTKAL